MKNVFTKVLLCCIAISFSCQDMCAKKDKNDKEDNDKSLIEAKIWFKDKRVYEGKMPKHWLTYRQTFLNPGHNFHIMPSDGTDKSIKCEASDVDSILITSSTHDSFSAGDFYIPAAGISFKKGRYKLIKRTYSGKHVDLCKMPYIGNCQQGQMALDQRMEYWYIHTKADDEIYLFFNNALEKRCQKPKFLPKDLAANLKDKYPELAAAILERFNPSKKAERKEIAEAVRENPMILVEFIDNYLSGKTSE